MHLNDPARPVAVLPSHPGRRLCIGFISLGCPKNQVDCELMLGAAQQAGFDVTPRIEEADAIVVNTCCFIAEAQDEAAREILKAQRFRERGRCRALVVTGCLPMYLRERASEQFPAVDAWLGPDAPRQLLEVLDGLLVPRDAAAAPPPLASPTFLPAAGMPRVLATPPGLAYVKIADGCNHRCRFCIIPRLRGRYRSRTIDDVAAEVRSLAERGIGEIALVSQDSTAYGSDRGGPELQQLLERLCGIPGHFWLRVMYLHPDGLTPELLKAWAALGPKLLPYFDLPLQHVSRRVLQAMGRGGGRGQVEDQLAAIRTACPAAIVRTSLISGYPGETEAEHRELLDWVAGGAIDHLGVFTYSDLPELSSHRLPDHVAPDTAQRRREELLAAQQPWIAQRHHRLLGCRLEVLLDARLSSSVRGQQLYRGRSWRDAYEIDGSVLVRSAVPLTLGGFAAVSVKASQGYDLSAEYSE